MTEQRVKTGDIEDVFKGFWSVYNAIGGRTDDVVQKELEVLLHQVKVATIRIEIANSLWTIKQSKDVIARQLEIQAELREQLRGNLESMLDAEADCDPLVSGEPNV